MNFRKTPLLLLSLALALGACAHGGKQVNTLEHKDQARPLVHYVDPATFTAQFPPPPAAGSPGQLADLAGVLAWQNKRTDDDCARAKRTSDETYDSFWGGRSLFPEPLPAEVREFFKRLASDLEASLDPLKHKYQRPRPFRAYPDEARPCAGLHKPKSFSYPSGHALFSRVFAHVLTELAPERRDEFFAKSDEISRDRLVGGVHYPADIEAGKLLGDRYYSELAGKDAYRAELERLRALLKK